MTTCLLKIKDIMRGRKKVETTSLVVKTRLTVLRRKDWESLWESYFETKQDLGSYLKTKQDQESCLIQDYAHWYLHLRRSKTKRLPVVWGDKTFSLVGKQAFYQSSHIVYSALQAAEAGSLPIVSFCGIPQPKIGGACAPSAPLWIRHCLAYIFEAWVRTDTGAP